MSWRGEPHQGTLFAYTNGTMVPVLHSAGSAAAAVDTLPYGGEPAAVGGYHAEQQKDGTWTIYDVPVFSVHVDTRGEEPEVYDAAWLKRAVALARTREGSDGYLGPLHKQHHPNPSVEAAGKFRLTGVKLLNYEGAPTPTIFADFVSIPDEVYQEVKDGAYPYRSVEIPGPDHAEVLSIALLDHEVPYFRYANMQIARESKAARKRSALVTRAYNLASGGHSHFTFRFHEEEAMPAPKKRTFAAGEVLTMLSTLQEGLMAMGDQLGAAMTALGDGAEGDTPPGQETDAVELRAAESDKDDEDETKAAAAEDDEDETKKAADGEEDEDEDETKSVVNARVAELQGENAALRQQLSDVSHATTKGSEFADVVEQFRIAGAPDKDVGALKELHKSGGIVAAKAYARSMSVTYRTMVAPPPTGFASTGELPKASAFPAEVVAYQAHGPDSFAEAKQVYATWSAGSKRHELSTYLAAHLEPGKFFNGKTAYAVK